MKDHEIIIERAAERALEDLYEAVWHEAEIKHDIKPSEVNGYLESYYSLYGYRDWWEAAGDGEEWT